MPSTKGCPTLPHTHSTGMGGRRTLRVLAVVLVAVSAPAHFSRFGASPSSSPPSLLARRRLPTRRWRVKERHWYPSDGTRRLRGGMEAGSREESDFLSGGTGDEEEADGNFATASATDRSRDGSATAGLSCDWDDSGTSNVEAACFKLGNEIRRMQAKGKASSVQKLSSKRDTLLRDLMQSRRRRNQSSTRSILSEAMVFDPRSQWPRLPAELRYRRTLNTRCRGALYREFDGRVYIHGNPFLVKDPILGTINESLCFFDPTTRQFSRSRRICKVDSPFELKVKPLLLHKYSLGKDLEQDLHRLESARRALHAQALVEYFNEKRDAKQGTDLNAQLMLERCFRYLGLPVPSEPTPTGDAGITKRGPVGAMKTVTLGDGLVATARAVGYHHEVEILRFHKDQLGRYVRECGINLLDRELFELCKVSEYIDSALEMGRPVEYRLSSTVFVSVKKLPEVSRWVVDLREFKLKRDLGRPGPLRKPTSTGILLHSLNWKKLYSSLDELEKTIKELAFATIHGRNGRYSKSHSSRRGNNHRVPP